MTLLTLDVELWDILEKAYHLYIAHIMPFTRTVLDNFFKKNSIPDRTIKTKEELDAIISLCEVCRKCSKRENKNDIEDSFEMQSIKTDLFLKEEEYIELMNFLSQLFEHREQYRLLHLKESINRNLGRRV